MYYREGVFGDRIIVDQTWALDAIYTLFKRDKPQFQRQIDKQKGRFTREDLALFFWGEHPVADQRTFLGFMEQCGICFRATPGYDTVYEGEYVIPDKLDRWGRDHERQFRRQLADGGGVEVTATFALLHDGIARGFLSKIGSVAGDKATYWRYGCHFFDEKTNAEALIRAEGNVVRIQTWGEKAGELAGTLVEVLKQVPCGQPPEITWEGEANTPSIVERDQSPEHRLAVGFTPGSELAALSAELRELSAGVLTAYEAANKYAYALAYRGLFRAGNGVELLRTALAEVFSRGAFRLFVLDLINATFDTGLIDGDIVKDLRARHESGNKGWKGTPPVPKYPIATVVDVTAEDATQDLRKLRNWSAHNPTELSPADLERVSNLFLAGTGKAVLDNDDRENWLRMQVFVVRRFRVVLDRYLAAFREEESRRVQALTR